MMESFTGDIDGLDLITEYLWANINGQRIKSAAYYKEGYIYYEDNGIINRRIDATVWARLHQRTNINNVNENIRDYLKGRNLWAI